jgi:phosphatidylethanolamine-binding protein (PEBP) family uncharacterized protein
MKEMARMQHRSIGRTMALVVGACIVTAAIWGLASRGQTVPSVEIESAMAAPANAGPAQPGPAQAAPAQGRADTSQPGKADQAASPYTLEQAISDRAQRTTIAFDALGFLTGTLGTDSFFPPGKVADFWGFQYLRDNDPSQMGHNTDFLTKAALNMYAVLTTEQRVKLVTLAKSQVSSINAYGYKRFVLMDAFRRQLEGDLPAGTTGLSESAVKAYSAKLYRLDGQISYARAQVMGGILSSLSSEQRASLDAMVGRGMLEWPAAIEPEDMRGLSRDEKVAVMTYSGDMFSWYAGSAEADVYFCPERHGTYFGSFYLKDAPAVGNPGYSIPTTITGDMGDKLLSVLDKQQAARVSGLVDAQRSYLLGIVATRRSVAAKLRLFMAGKQAGKTTVMELMERYGALDGAIVYRYATAFSAVGRTLTTNQKTQLTALRRQLLGDLKPDGAFLYSQAIPMPEIADTDFLFGAGTAAPAVTRLSPTSARRGVTVTITGARFGAKRGTSFVTFGATRCTRYVSWSATRIKCKVPASAAFGPLKVRVTTSSGTGSGRSFTVKGSSSFTLTSGAFHDGGTLPAVYTADGTGISPPLAWTTGPKGTVQFAVMMTTLALDGKKWNWVLYGIPADVTSLAAGTDGVGIAGLTSDGPESRYYPPNSQGPGPKTYTLTVYALSGTPTFTVPAGEVNGAALTSAISKLTLASSRLSVTYTRT